MAKRKIELHIDELKSVGIDIRPLSWLDETAEIPHRDDHYMFIVQKKGEFLLEIDFREVLLSDAAVSYVASGQVHRYLKQKDCDGWFVFIETALVSKTYLEIFNTYLNSNQLVSVSAQSEIFSLVPVFESVLKGQSAPFQKELTASLAESLVGLVVRDLAQTHHSEKLIGGKKHKTLIEFKQLIQTHYKNSKQVQEYASLLNITPLYLNELIKELTGFSASYWIHQEIILEAQRLLYYTDLDIKEIAFELGFEDHAYFSRFFKKHTAVTASHFRNKKPLFI
ncbi:AraC family transcriptional regulator [Chryseobacterium sp. JUb7]|uniref:AraC family transcriptional regulator n=1 Tax=Chryseobacterium sp. JUb7 TaxID=2940599 RepID=UPI002168F5D8|nr:AraC family transcriptional regulator [Chryseobacterium sp. JUb7]MCS3528940.1 YesN/AraC family two-component response regulator [Chryseobacterium sp. JUb7]